MGCADSKEKASRPDKTVGKSPTRHQRHSTLHPGSAPNASPQSPTSPTQPHQGQQWQQSYTASLKAGVPGSSSSAVGSSRYVVEEGGDEGSTHGGDVSGASGDGHLCLCATTPGPTPSHSATAGGDADGVPPRVRAPSSSPTPATGSVQGIVEVERSCTPPCATEQEGRELSTSPRTRQQADSVEHLRKHSPCTVSTASSLGWGQHRRGTDDTTTVVVASTAPAGHKPPPPPSCVWDGPLMLEVTMPHHSTPPPPPTPPPPSAPLGSHSGSPSSPPLGSLSPPPRQTAASSSPWRDQSPLDTAAAVPRQLRWGSSGSTAFTVEGSSLVVGTPGDTTTNPPSRQHTAKSTQPPTPGMSRSSSCQPAPQRQRQQLTQHPKPLHHHHHHHDPRQCVPLPSSVREGGATAASPPAQCLARPQYHTRSPSPVSWHSSSTPTQAVPSRQAFPAGKTSAPIESASSVSSPTASTATHTRATSPARHRPSSSGQAGHATITNSAVRRLIAARLRGTMQRLSPSELIPLASEPQSSPVSTSPAPSAVPLSLDAPSDLPLPEHLADLPFCFPLSGTGLMGSVNSNGSGSGGGGVGAPRTPPLSGMLSYASYPRRSPTQVSIDMTQDGLARVPAEPLLLSPYNQRLQQLQPTTSGTWLMSSLTSNDNVFAVGRGGGSAVVAASACDGGQSNTPPTNSELVRQIQQPTTHVKSILRKSGSFTTSTARVSGLMAQGATITPDIDPPNAAIHSRVLSLSVNGVGGGAGASGSGGRGVGEGTGYAASPHLLAIGGAEGRHSGPSSLVEATLRTDSTNPRKATSELGVSNNGGGCNAGSAAFSVGTPSPHNQVLHMHHGFLLSGLWLQQEQSSSGGGDGAAAAAVGSGTNQRCGSPSTMLPSQRQSGSPLHEGNSGSTTVIGGGGGSSTSIMVSGEGCPSRVTTPSASACGAALLLPALVRSSSSAPLSGFQSPAAPHRSGSAGGGGAGGGTRSLSSGSATQSVNSSGTPGRKSGLSTQLSREGYNAVSCTSNEPPPDIMLATPPPKRVHVVV